MGIFTHHQHTGCTGQTNKRTVRMCNLMQEAYDEAVGMYRSCAAYCGHVVMNSMDGTGDGIPDEELDVLCNTQCKGYLDCIPVYKSSTTPEYQQTTTATQQHEENVDFTIFIIVLLLVITVLVCITTVTIFCIAKRCKQNRRDYRNVNKHNPDESCNGVELIITPECAYSEAHHTSLQSDLSSLMQQPTQPQHITMFNASTNNLQHSSQHFIQEPNIAAEQPSAELQVRTVTTSRDDYSHPSYNSGLSLPSMLGGTSASSLPYRIHTHPISLCSSQMVSVTSNYSTDSMCSGQTIRIWSAIPNDVKKQLERIRNFCTVELTDLGHMLVTVIGTSVGAAREVINSTTALEDHEYLVRLIVEPPGHVYRTSQEST